MSELASYVATYITDYFSHTHTDNLTFNTSYLKLEEYMKYFNNNVAS